MYTITESANSCYYYIILFPEAANYLNIKAFRIEIQQHRHGCCLCGNRCTLNRGHPWGGLGWYPCYSFFFFHLGHYLCSWDPTSWPWHCRPPTIPMNHSVSTTYQKTHHTHCHCTLTHSHARTHTPAESRAGIWYSYWAAPQSLGFSPCSRSPSFWHHLKWDTATTWIC